MSLLESVQLFQLIWETDILHCAEPLFTISSVVTKKWYSDGTPYEKELLRALDNKWSNQLSSNLDACAHSETARRSIEDRLKMYHDHMYLTRVVRNLHHSHENRRKWAISNPSKL